MKDNDNYSFDDLFDAWQQESGRIDRLVREHPVAEEHIDFRTGRPRNWRPLTAAALRALVCLAALVWLVCLYDSRVADILDLIPHLLVGALLLCSLLSSLAALFLLGRRRAAAPPLLCRSRFSRTAACAAVAALLIIVATPAYDGRSMSLRDAAGRADALADADKAIDNLSCTHTHA